MSRKPINQYEIRRIDTDELVCKGSAWECAVALGTSTTSIYYNEQGKSRYFHDKLGLNIKKIASRLGGINKSAVQTLCWDCANTSGAKCPWFAEDAKPVDGWTAERNDVQTFNGSLESYFVTACPLFKEGRK